ncbi:MAG: M50 family metallopeptidase [Gaiellales bacterium]
MTMLYAIVGLGVLIFVHELGHFLVSLSLGMRPRRFYIGFPPAIVSVKRRGIEYGIGAIPLGGFVKIPGMHRPAGSDVEAAFGLVREEAPPLAPMIDGLRNVVDDGDEQSALERMATLEREIADRPLSAAARRLALKGIDDLRDALGPDAYWRAATWKRVAAIAAGPLANIVLALVLFTGLYMTSAGKATSLVDRVDEKTPAAAIGLEHGDRIVAINGARVTADEIASTIAASRGRMLVVTVVRGGSELVLPAARPELEDGRYRLGFALTGKGLGPVAAVGESFRLTGRVARDIGASLGRLVHGEGRKDISSPVGIVQGSSAAAKQGADDFFFVLGLISLSIALLNLLPLLPLDGGHIVFAVAEGLRGRSVRREIYERVSIVGIGLVVLLFFIGLSNDLTGPS